jgi:hypothetical protein
MSRLERSFRRDVDAAGLDAGPGPADPVAERDVEGLPEVVRRYLAFMGVVGRPRTWSFRARFSGRFRMRPDQRWMPAEAWQYDTRLGIARVFTMRVRLGGVVPMVGHDTYVRGRGRMLGKLAGVLKVVDGSGPELDRGELATWLNDAVLLAPSMLLGPGTEWQGLDDGRFRIALRDGDLQVSATVTVDEQGAPTDFTTTDRWADLPGGLVRARWSTPVEGWDVVDGRRLPRPGGATWHLAEGPFTYVEGGFVPGSVVYDVPP